MPAATALTTPLDQPNSYEPELITEISFDGDPTATYTDSVQNSAPSGYWRLNESSGTAAADSSGNLYTGTYTGGFTLLAGGALPGDTDGAVSLNGTTGYVSVAANSGHQNVTAAWTVEAWIRQSSALGAADDVGIIVHEFVPGSLPFVLGVGSFSGSTSGKRPWAGFYNAGWYTVADTTDVPINAYTYLAATWDGTTLTFYRDGVAVSTATPGATPAAANAAAHLYIGRRWDAGGTINFFPGRIDEPAFYAKALSAQTIQNHHLAKDTPISFTYTDVSADVISLSTQRGRVYELDQIATGTATTVLDNSMRQYEPEFAGSPYYPNIVPLKRMRHRAANNELSNSTFVTDTSGWTASTVYPAVTNYATDPSVEAGILRWGKNQGTETTSQSTTHAQFSTNALKLITPGGVNQEGVIYPSAPNGTGAGTAAVGETWTVSAYVFASGGERIIMELDERNSSGTNLANTQQAFTLVAGWQRVSVTRTLNQATVSQVNFKFITSASGGAQAITVWLDGAQLEKSASATTYCDGTQTNCIWNGAANASTSSRASFATLTRDTVTYHDGGASMKVVTAGLAVAEGVVTTSGITVATGDEVRVRFWIKAPAVSMQFQVTEFFTGILERTTTYTFTGNNTWQQYSAVLTSGLADTVKLGVSTAGTTATTFNLDQVKLMRVYPIFSGFIESLPVSWPGNGLDYGVVSITANDGFELLALPSVTVAIASTTADQTIDALLSAANWPRGGRRTDGTGWLTMAALNLTSTPALSMIQQIADSEVGLFFFDRQGKPFTQSHALRTTAAYTTSTATFSDMSDGYDYADLTPSLDKQRIINDWQISPDTSVSGGAAQESTDETSIRKYGRRTNSRQTTLASNADALSQASFLVGNTATPTLRVDSIKIEPLSTIAIWQAVLAREISDRITIERTPSSGIIAGSPMTKQGYIEGINWRIDVNQAWQVEFPLSPASSATYFTLDDSTKGKLDSGNSLFF